MKVIGIALVILGALALGYGGFTYVTTERVAAADQAEVTRKQVHRVWIPPTVGGIVLVSGLILITIVARRQ